MTQHIVLIVSDETEFLRLVVSRWQAEPVVPAFTMMTSDLWTGAALLPFDVAVIGPLNTPRAQQILNALEATGRPVIVVSSDPGVLEDARKSHGRVVGLEKNPYWLDTLVLVAGEALRRSEAQVRARNAEISANASQRHAMLGQYIVEMRHSFNNALTTVLGNAELLLLEPGQLEGHARDQVDTIHSMALRMNEIMQRLSSLDSELQTAEKRSQVETVISSQSLAAPA